MNLKRLTSTLLIFYLISGAALGADGDVVDLGRWSETELARIIATAHRNNDPGDRIAAISGHFLGTPYAADTLVGGPQTTEQLVIDLAGVDCFTFLDEVEALRRASNLADFPEQLKQVRYRGGQVTYENRRHFFSDWVAADVDVIGDVTAAVGRGRARVVVKQLNLKADGTYGLQGIPVTRREITYIPATEIDGNVLAALRPGDYVGIYTDQPGFDVSHVGLIVKGKDGVMLRHASSLDSARRVVDVDLLGYLRGKPGLVVYRVRISSNLLYGCGEPPATAGESDVAATLTREFGAEQPKLWAENLPGIMRYLDYPSGDRKIALTLDACGSKHDGYDWELIDFLIAERIPATLFVNARWIDKNPQVFKALADNPLFDIQNHGQNHLPASVNGRSVYGIKGTANIGELVAEVDANGLKIARLTGAAPTWFRSGTAYYDEVAVRIIHHLGQKIAGFSVLGDAGTTYTAVQIERTLALVQPNDIIIAHMNHPDHETAEGLIPALTKLKARGFTFVTLREAPTRDTPPAGYRHLKRDPSLDINVYPLGSEMRQRGRR